MAEVSQATAPQGTLTKLKEAAKRGAGVLLAAGQPLSTRNPFNSLVTNLTQLARDIGKLPKNPTKQQKVTAAKKLKQMSKGLGKFEKIKGKAGLGPKDMLKFTRSGTLPSGRQAGTKSLFPKNMTVQKAKAFIKKQFTSSKKKAAQIAKAKPTEGGNLARAKALAKGGKFKALQQLLGGMSKLSSPLLAIPKVDPVKLREAAIRKKKGL